MSKRDRVGGDDVAALSGIVPVSRETAAGLEAFVALLRKWQTADNLVSSKTLPEVWHRHVADCAQLVPLFPKARLWLDLGSGAGFPGMVVAILTREMPGAHVHLVESNRRKCAFLRQAIRVTGAAASVREGRAEDLLENWQDPVDRVIARALAPLDELLGLAWPVMKAGTPAAFHKGGDFAREIAEARENWSCDLVKHESRIGDRGVILEISALRRKQKSGSTAPES